MPIEAIDSLESLDCNVTIVDKIFPTSSGTCYTESSSISSDGCSSDGCPTVVAMPVGCPRVEKIDLAYLRKQADERRYRERGEFHAVDKLALHRLLEKAKLENQHLQSKVKKLEQDNATSNKNLEYTQIKLVNLANRCFDLEQKRVDLHSNNIVAPEKKKMVFGTTRSKRHDPVATKSIIENLKAQNVKITNEATLMKNHYTDQIDSLVSTMNKFERKSSEILEKRNKEIVSLQKRKNLLAREIITLKADKNQNTYICEQRDDGNEKKSETNELNIYEELEAKVIELENMNNHLTKDLVQTKDQIVQVELQTENISELEKKLKYKLKTLEDYETSHMAYDQIDNEEKEKLKASITDMSEDEENFMNQLDSLEMDMSSVVKELENLS